MPEGDTIHKLARRLSLALEGGTLRELTLDGVRQRRFEGQRIESVEALGKHLLLLTEELVFRSHLGMHGKWLQVDGRESRSWRRPSAIVRTDEVAFTLVRAKEVDVLDRRGNRFRRLRTWIGPDLLAPGTDVASLATRARALVQHAPVVDLLLDQRVASGIGNVYKSEVLFLQGVHPLTGWRELNDESLAGLFRRAQKLLRANLGPGPRRTRAPHPGSTGARNPEDSHYWVYGRKGEPCRACGERIRFDRCGRHGRGTWWCPRCQSAESGTALT